MTLSQQQKELILKFLKSSVQNNQLVKEVTEKE
jgi:hypothetical protein